MNGSIQNAPAGDTLDVLHAPAIENAPAGENTPAAGNVSAAAPAPSLFAILQSKFKLRWDWFFNPVPSKKRLWVYVHIHPDAIGSEGIPGHHESKYKFAFVSTEKDNVQRTNGVRYEQNLDTTGGQQDRWVTTRTTVDNVRRGHDIGRVCVGKILDNARLDHILSNSPTPTFATEIWDPAMMNSGWMVVAWKALTRSFGVVAPRSKKWTEIETTINHWMKNMAGRTRDCHLSRGSVTHPLDLPAAQRPRTMDGLPIIHEDTEPSPILDMTRRRMVEYADTASIAELSTKANFPPMIPILFEAGLV